MHKLISKTMRSLIVLSIVLAALGLLGISAPMSSGSVHISKGYQSIRNSILTESTFTLAGLLRLKPAEYSAKAAVMDPAGDFIYFGTSTNPGLIVKVRLSDFKRVSR